MKTLSILAALSIGCGEPDDTKPTGDGPENPGIDTGGTFTDAVRPREDGSLQVFKLPTTPRRPAQGRRRPALRQRRLPSLLRASLRTLLLLFRSGAIRVRS